MNDNKNVPEYLKQFPCMDELRTGMYIPFDIAIDKEKRKRWQLIQQLSMT